MREQFYKALRGGMIPVGSTMIRLMRKELADQGHGGSGSGLSKSIKAKVDVRKAETRINIIHRKYGIYVSKGVRPSRIPFSGRRRGRVGRSRPSKYIEGLKRFVLRTGKASSNKEALNIAFAIAHTQKREGMPTRGSYAYSRNGRRKGWNTHPIKAKKEIVTGELKDAGRAAILAGIRTMTKKFNGAKISI